jgi:SAM-dependent methyltransferase
MIKTLKHTLVPFRKLVYMLSGKKPWSYGYNDTRWAKIAQSIRNNNLLAAFNKGAIPLEFGIGFDERMVEYPWIFSKIKKDKAAFLDAGSTFNFTEIISHPDLSDEALTIFTYYPEHNNFCHKRISYVYGDLREMPFRSNYFSQVVCQSTIEHVDMDNAIYGYELKKNENEAAKSYEYLKVIHELIRVLKPGGQLLLTFPYGKFEHHGFFQQFDAEMVNHMKEVMYKAGTVTDEYMAYHPNGWRFETAEACKNIISFNPHTGKGKGTDGAAHCRCVCCITFIKD